MVKVIKIGEEDEETTPIPDEELITTELDDYKIKQKFVKKVYYTLIGVLYFAFCALFNYYVIGVEYYGQEISFETEPLLWFFLDTFVLALIFPIVLLILSFASGGILFGVFGGLTYGSFGLLARGIMKILGFDLELIFPELVGHTGVVSKPNILFKFTSYNLSVEIEKAGLYGNSFWHGNKIAARSKEGEIPVGTNVDVIEANYWSLSSLLRNSPVITVVPIGGQVLESEVEEKSFLREMANIFRIVLLLIGILFIFLAGLGFSTCNATGCGTVMDTVHCFSVSIISFILYFYLGRVE